MGADFRLLGIQVEVLMGGYSAFSKKLAISNGYALMGDAVLIAENYLVSSGFKNLPDFCTLKTRFSGLSL